MPDFGIMRGFADKLFGDKLYAGQLPTFLGLIGSIGIGFNSILKAAAQHQPQHLCWCRIVRVITLCK
jgi:hypothetical protein